MIRPQPYHPRVVELSMDVTCLLQKTDRHMSAQELTDALNALILSATSLINVYAPNDGLQIARAFGIALLRMVENETGERVQ